MVSVAIAEELAGTDELEELYKLNASESEPEDEQGAEEAEEGAESGGMPHGAEPEGMPHG